MNWFADIDGANKRMKVVDYAKTIGFFYPLLTDGVIVGAKLIKLGSLIHAGTGKDIETT